MNFNTQSFLRRQDKPVNAPEQKKLSPREQLGHLRIQALETLKAFNNPVTNALTDEISMPKGVKELGLGMVAITALGACNVNQLPPVTDRPTETINEHTYRNSAELAPELAKTNAETGIFVCGTEITVTYKNPKTGKMEKHAVQGTANIQAIANAAFAESATDTTPFSGKQETDVANKVNKFTIFSMPATQAKANIKYDKPNADGTVTQVSAPFSTDGCRIDKPDPSLTPAK
jgi:hypothetical protein